MLMIEAVRSLGMAARFVSGYLHIPDDDDERYRAAATRMPGLKSICLDPVGSISIHPMASLAIATSFVSRWCAIRARRYRSMEPGRGRSTDYLGMKVEVAVTSDAAKSERANANVAPRYEVGYMMPGSNPAGAPVFALAANNLLGSPACNKLEIAAGTAVSWG